jgi:hypothetical protein
MTRSERLRKDEYDLAFKFRTCPSNDILFSDNLSLTDRENLDKHLSFCESCRDNKEAGPYDPGVLIKSFGSTPEPKPAQIWRLNNKLSGWIGGGRYCNPPAVMILSMPTTKKRKLTVVQVHSFETLKHEGDVQLKTTDGLLWYAETWNAPRKLNLDDLKACISQADPTQLPLIQSAIDSKTATTNLPEYVFKFRTLEREIGEAIESMSMYLEFANYKAPLFYRVMSAIKDMGKDFINELSKLNPGWIIPDSISDLQFALAKALPAPDAVPYFGDGSTGNSGDGDTGNIKYLANCLREVNGAMHMEVKSYSIVNTSTSGNCVVIDVKLSTPASFDTKIQAWLEINETEKCQAIDSDLEKLEKGKADFELEFEGINEKMVKSGKLILMLFGEEQEQ